MPRLRHGTLSHAIGYGGQVRKGLRHVGVLVLTIALLLPASSAHATFPGKNGRLAFSRWQEPEIGLMTANPDGSGIRRLTRAASFESPSWSADGRRIVYVRGEVSFSGNVLGIMRPDGTGRVRVPFYPSEELYGPSFSPAGRRIVTRWHRGRMRIWTLRLDGSDRRMLLKDLPGAMEGGVFSPDGRSIAFSYSPPDAEHASIYTVRTDGTGLRRITFGNFRDSGPDWAPGSGRLVFSRVSTGSFSPVNLMIVNRGGARLRAITDVRRYVYAQDAVWSPDGRWIVYHQLSSPQVLRRIRPDGSGGRRAIAGTDHNMMPSWQPLPR